MRLKLYCNRYAHFKDALVCSVNCTFRTRCHDFALFYDEHRDDVDQAVADYYAARSSQWQEAETQPSRAEVRRAGVLSLVQPTDLRTLIRLEVKREMAEAFYIWVDKEDRAELVETKEVLRRAERGSKPKHIYKVSQEMELRFQLVPRKRIEKAKQAAEADEQRARARRARSAGARQVPAPVPFPAPVSEEHTDAPARARTRVARSAGRR